MNARLYDPLLHRFLAPDNYVQDPYSTQNFNRYGYVLNNPLKYNDPSGEFIFTIIGALLAPVTGGASLALGIAMDVGGGINLGMKAMQGKIHSFKDGLVAYGIGAAAGGVGYLTGGAAFAAAGGAAGGAGGFIAGAAGGAVGTAFASPIQNIGNHLYFGDKLMSLKQYATGVLMGGVFGGVVNGGIALSKGRSFWNGAHKPVQAIDLSQQIKPVQLTPRQKGDIGVHRAIEEIKTQGGTVRATEVTLEVNGVRVRVDVAADFNGKIVLYEVKNGPSAGFTPNQKIVYPKMLDGAQVIPRGMKAIPVWGSEQIGQPTNSYILIIKKY